MFIVLIILTIIVRKLRVQVSFFVRSVVSYAVVSQFRAPEGCLWECPRRGGPIFYPQNLIILPGQCLQDATVVGLIPLWEVLTFARTSQGRRAEEE